MLGDLEQLKTLRQQATPENVGFRDCCSAWRAFTLSRVALRAIFAQRKPKALDRLRPENACVGLEQHVLAVQAQFFREATLELAPPSPTLISGERSERRIGAFLHSAFASRKSRAALPFLPFLLKCPPRTLSILAIFARNLTRESRKGV